MSSRISILAGERGWQNGTTKIIDEKLTFKEDTFYQRSVRSPDVLMLFNSAHETMKFLYTVNVFFMFSQ